jgi:hypothetical protein
VSPSFDLKPASRETVISPSRDGGGFQSARGKPWAAHVAYDYSLISKKKTRQGFKKPSMSENIYVSAIL